MLTIRPIRVSEAEARRRSMASHPAGSARLGELVAFPLDRVAVR